MDLTCQNIHYAVGQKEILRGISLRVEGNQFHTILGPNGSGKTSLLKTIYRQIKPDSGDIYLNGRPLEQVSIKKAAQKIAVVTQFNHLQFDCTVQEIVMLGRTPHLSLFQKESEKDYALVRHALSQVDMLDKGDRTYLSLSGGEKQRVLPSLLLLDEPTNHLDIKYQLDMLRIVKDLNINVLAVLHDIQLACRYSDYLYLMKGGEIAYQGAPKEAITHDSLQAVYGIQSKVIWTKDRQAMIQYL